MSGKARWLGVGHGGWLVLAVLLCLGRLPLSAQGVVVGEGDRVRVWLGPAMVPPGQTGTSLKGKLLAIAGDTVELNTGHSSMTLRRDAIVRIDRSVGRPHAWRNARYAFYATLVLGTVLNVAVSRTCGTEENPDFSAGGCFAVFTVGLVLPASGLAALIAGVSAREQFVPARLPPPGAVMATQASWAR